MIEHPPSVVSDTNGARYELDRFLGAGGQGSVFTVRGSDLAVKLLETPTPEWRQRVDENIARLKRLPLRDLNVARPLRALAKPYAGYVMELMTAMLPIRTLTHPPRDAAADLLPWYIDSGGLRRRLRLLANAADVFRALHGRGLTYGDTSPDNVFVSEDLSAFEVWLIDCDNVMQGVSPRVVYTPGYAAPEVFGTHAGADSLTDAWSLATICFETLCALHPFDGDMVQDGEPELEEQAFQGRLPWVDDTSDDTNRASRGLPREFVLTRGLRDLMQQTFEAGRHERLDRPGTAAWATRLHQAADQTLQCPGCTGTYYLNLTSCPWCDTPAPPFVLVNVFRRFPDWPNADCPSDHVVRGVADRPTLADRTAVQASATTSLTPRVLAGTDERHEELRMSYDGTVLEIVATGTAPWVLEHRGRGERRAVGPGGVRLDLRSGSSHWWIVPANATGVHRVVAFEARRGGQE